MNPKRMIAVAAACLLAFGPALLAQRGYNYHSLQVKDELGRVVTDLTSVKICTSGTTTGQTIYLEAALTNQVTNPITTGSSNTTLTQASGSCYWYGTDAYDVTLVSTTYGTIHLKGYTSATSTVIIPTYWTASQSQTTTDAQSLSLGTDADWVIAAGATADRLTMTPATDGATLYLGSTASQADIYFWQAAATYMWWDESAGTLKFVGTEALFDDDSQLQLGTSADFVFDYDGSGDDLDVTGDDKELALGADGAGFDVYWHTENTGDNVYFDEDNAEVLLTDVDIQFDDDADAIFGTDNDFVIESDTANTLEVIPAAAGNDVKFGISAGTSSVDIYWYADTSGDYVLFDEENVDVDFIDVDLDMDDDAYLRFGTGDDLYLKYAGGTNVLNLGQTVTDTGSVTVGADGNGVDVTLYGEEVGDYLKWDATGASKLLLVGADSSGTLFGITGIDTTGNSDTMTIAHSGTGDALQITCTEADSVALNLIAATSQTTSVLKVDGATGSWVGATGVGMVNLTNDGALAHVNSSLLFIDNDGVPQNDARGTCLRIDDDGNASAGTAGYSVYVSTTDATMEAIYVDDGKVKVDETIEVGGSINGLGTAELVGLLDTVEIFVDDDTLLAAESGKVCICDGNDGGAANVILTLPTAEVGLRFTFSDANSTAGDDLYIKAAAGDTIAGGAAAQYLACKTDAVSQSVTLEAIDETRWIILSSVGTWAADDSPD